MFHSGAWLQRFADAGSTRYQSHLNERCEHGKALPHEDCPLSRRCWWTAGELALLCWALHLCSAKQCCHVFSFYRNVTHWFILVLCTGHVLDYFHGGVFLCESGDWFFASWGWACCLAVVWHLHPGWLSHRRPNHVPSGQRLSRVCPGSRVHG